MDTIVGRLGCEVERLGVLGLSTVPAVGVKGRRATSKAEVSVRKQDAGGQGTGR